MRSHVRFVSILIVLGVAGCSAASQSGGSPSNGNSDTDAGGGGATGGGTTGGGTSGGGDAGTSPVTGAIAASPMFGFSESNTNPSAWPNVGYGMQRFWDSPPLQWPSLNPSQGVFDFTNLDADLALAYSKGTTEGMYTLARTPPWATSKPNDTSCNYPSTSVGGGNGECDAPSDLNTDGSGTNAIWKAWITAIATHANDPTYLKTHAHIRYWEIWNEPDTAAFYAGTIAQLARMTEDANCIITGRGVVHEHGDGTATTCTASAIDPDAKIVMASAHAKAVALQYGANELYCNDSPAAYQLPCPNPKNAIATAVDIINFHMKPGNETGNDCEGAACTPENAMKMYVDNVKGILQPAELAKPLWNGEASYSKSGFVDAYVDPDMAASFMPRFWLIDASLGISGHAWYSEKNTPAQATTALNQTIAFMVGATITSACTPTGNVYACGVKTKDGQDHLVVWDSSKSCSAGSCTTASYAVDSKWTTYRDLTTASTAQNISGGSIALGIKPIVLSE